MNQVTLIVGETPVTALLLRSASAGGGRAIYRVSVASKLRLGESCILRDSAGRTLECFVVETAQIGETFFVDLKCLEDPDFQKAAGPEMVPE